jgi:hypothetical protein
MRLALALILFSATTTLAVERLEETRPPSRTASWLVEPGVGIGPVRLGMRTEDLKMAIGDPDPARVTEQGWVYTEDSFGVTFADALVTMIDAGNGFPLPGSAEDRFKGRTREGIGIGSTRAEVVAAMGTPRSFHKDPNEPDVEFLSYRELGVIVELWKGRVTSMIVHRHAP